MSLSEFSFYPSFLSCFPLLLFASWDSHLLATELALASTPWDFMISFQSVRLPESFPRAEIHLASLALFTGQGLYAMHSSFGQYSLPLQTTA